MFEAVIAVCLAGQGAPCRDVLVPGFEAASLAACETALTVPEARCVPTGPALSVQEVAPGVFVHVGAVAEPDADNRGDVANLGFVVGGASVAVIDTGSARWMGEALWRAIRARTDLPVSHAIVTHMHPDHAFGASLFAEAGAEVVGHANLPRALADRQINYLVSMDRLVGAAAMIGTQVAPVTMPVQEAAQIDLGGRVLDVQAWPMAHTGNDLTVLDGATGVLFTGDLLFDRHTPALDGSLLGWQDVLEQLGALPATLAVPGHGAATLPWPEGAADLSRYLSVLAADTRAAIAAGERLGDAVAHIAEAERPHWYLFDAYTPRNATVAFTELEWE